MTNEQNEHELEHLADELEHGLVHKKKQGG
jgi:hypothetical protein